MANILIVDDEPPILDLMSTIVRGMHHDVFRAEDGHEASLMLLQRPEQYRLVITDIKMPHTSGLGLASWILRCIPGVRVIVVSGLITDRSTSTVRQLLAEGCSAVVGKPFRIEEIHQAVEKALAWV